MTRERQVTASRKTTNLGRKALDQRSSHLCRAPCERGVGLGCSTGPLVGVSRAVLVRRLFDARSASRWTVSRTYQRIENGTSTGYVTRTEIHRIKLLAMGWLRRRGICDSLLERGPGDTAVQAARRPRSAQQDECVSDSALLGSVLRMEELECRAMLTGTTLHWIGGNAAWDTTAANWLDGTSDVALQNGDTAIFDGTAATVTIAPGAAISAAEIDFATGGYTIAAGTGGSLAVSGSGTVDVAAGISDTISAPLVGSNGLTLPDSGTLLLSAANSFTGATVIEAGILQLGNSLALSGTSISALSSGTLDLNGKTVDTGVPLDDFAGTLTNSDTGVAASFGATINATTQDSFTVSGSGDITLGAAVYGSSTVTLTKSGGNTLTIADASEYDGLSVNIDDGNVVQGGSATYTSLDIGAGSTMTIAPSGPGIAVTTTLDWDPGQTGPTTGVASGGKRHMGHRHRRLVQPRHQRGSGLEQCRHGHVRRQLWRRDARQRHFGRRSLVPNRRIHAPRWLARHRRLRIQCRVGRQCHGRLHARRQHGTFQGRHGQPDHRRHEFLQRRDVDPRRHAHAGQFRRPRRQQRRHRQHRRHARLERPFDRRHRSTATFRRHAHEQRQTPPPRSPAWSTTIRLASPQVSSFPAPAISR